MGLVGVFVGNFMFPVKTGVFQTILQEHLFQKDVI
jgi:hypothetical protein